MTGKSQGLPCYSLLIRVDLCGQHIESGKSIRIGDDYSPPDLMGENAHAALTATQAPDKYSMYIRGSYET